MVKKFDNILLVSIHYTNVMDTEPSSHRTITKAARLQPG